MSGYDGSEIRTGARVEIHPGCDLWMMGARYGRVSHISTKGYARVRLDRLRRTVRFPVDRLRSI